MQQQIAGAQSEVLVFGVRLVGVNAENGKKLLLSVAFIAVVWLIAWLLRRVASFLTGDRWRKLAFWVRQGIHLLSAALVLVGLCSVWFDNPARLTTAFGLVTAALQRVITAFVACIVIRRGSFPALPQDSSEGSAVAVAPAPALAHTQPCEESLV